MGSTVTRRSQLALVLAFVMVGSMLTIPASNVQADQSTADDYGYRWTDNVATGPTVSFNWIDITATGTDTGIDGDDDSGAGPYPIGFDFEFYGNTYSELNISTNGLITFGYRTSTLSNTNIPSSSTPNDYIAPYWDDLCVDYSVYNDGSILYETSGTAPNRQMVIEFYEISRWTSSSLMTFEVILNETGEIWFQYLDLSGMTGDSATVGIENSTGTAGCEYSTNTAALVDGLAVMFDVSGVFILPDQEAMDVPGSSVDYTLSVTNNQDISDTLEIDCDSDFGWTTELYDGTMTPLADSNANTVPDTGLVAPDDSSTVIVRVTIPGSPTERLDIARVNAFSFFDSAVFDVALLTTYVTPMEISPPHEEWVPDDDTDLLYDSLTVNVSVDAQFSDVYLVRGILSDSLGAYIGSAYSYVAGGPGVFEMPLVFDGEVIFAAGLDGPYEVEIFLDDANYTYSTSDTYVTTAYSYLDFERPKVVITPPHTDHGWDTDGDSLYEHLVVEVSLEVYEEDGFHLYADISDSFGRYITSTYNDTGTLAVGTHTIQLWFSGIDIRDSGYNGPYDVYIELYDYSWAFFGDDIHITNVYAWDEFQTRATFGSPHVDYGSDTDSDTYFNYLVVEAMVNVSVLDDYTVYGYLYDSSWVLIASVTVVQTFDVGSQIFVLLFDGLSIRNNEADGPYNVELYLYCGATGYLEYGLHVTGGYFFDEFEAPDMCFEQPHSDCGLDAGGDLLYEYLVIEAQVNVTVAGNYIVGGYLYDSGWSYLEYSENSTYLATGLRVVEVWFSGSVIQANGDSGQYHVDLYAYDEAYAFLDFDTYTTSSYAYEEFQPGIGLSPPHVDYGTDTDSDGLYNYLTVEVTVVVTTADDYYIYGDLYDSLSSWIVSDGALYTLDVGTHQVELSFDGLAISDNGEDGPFTLDIYAYDDSWTLMDTDTHTTADYAETEFQRDGAEFSPPYSDHCLDVNADGYYDFLVIEVPIDVAIAGNYELDVYLYSPSWNYIGNENLVEYFTIGVQTFEVYFPGLSIRNEGESGQFQVGFDLYYESVGYLDTDWYTTGWYVWDDFTMPLGFLSPPHSDYGLDTDSDTLYNHLVVEVAVDINVAGSVEVYGSLYSWWGGYICDASVSDFLDTGAHTLELEFDGWIIRSYGTDGPYTVELELYDSYSGLMDSGVHDTAAYGWDEFETAPATLAPPYTDYGQDTGSDGLYDYLVIEIPVDVDSSGDYMLELDLYDDSWSFITSVEVDASLAVGSGTVTVVIDGWTIRLNELDGPYYFEMNLYDDSWTWLDYDWSATNTYSWGDFQTAACEFGPTHSDYGLDDDADGLFEYLIINVSVNVSVAGTYSIWATLFDDASDLVDVELFEFTVTTLGATIVELEFDGWQAFASGLLNGSYLVDMLLEDTEGAWLDGDTYITGVYLQEDFESAVPLITSVWSATSPTIDGVFSEDEWANATSVVLEVDYPEDSLDAVLLVMNNETHVFVCYDAIGDLTEDMDDVASISFDTGGDGNLTFGGEDQFVVGGTGWVPNGEAHYVYGLGTWVLDCTPFNELLVDHEGLMGATGFGISDNLVSDHRVYELSIPLALLEAELGDTLGFLGGSEIAPGVFDGFTSAYSSWPLYFDTLPEIAFFGDLRLSTSSPPTTTVDLTGVSGQNGWYLSEVEFALTAEDIEEGINCTMFQLDGADWTEYVDTVTVSSAGVHLLEFYSLDNAGNPEMVESISIMIDLTDPSTSASVSGTVGEDGWYTSAASVTLSASDAALESGVDNTVYSIDSEPWVTYAGSSVSLAIDGVYVIEFESEDVAGRDEDTKSVTVKVDLNAPVTSAVAHMSVVNITADDNVSGVNVTMYRIDGGDWVVYVGGEVELEGAGNHTVEYYSIDNAGNVEEVKTLVVDVPSGGILGAPDWLLLLILAVVGICVAVVVFAMRRRAKSAGSPPVAKDQASSTSQSYDGSDPNWPYEPPSVAEESGGSGDGDLPPPSK